MEKIALTIDGKEVSGIKGQTILEVARDNGIAIPTLCFHPRISKTGACRICIVRVNGQMLKTSCTEPATNGISVETDDPEITEIRRGLLELLLAEGDHNCLYCDANGDCELQSLCYRYGIEVSTGDFPKNYREKDFESSEGLRRNENRCVLCGRCVKACGEIQMNRVWNFAGRGSNTHLTSDLFDKLGDSSCVQCGQLRSALPDRRAFLPDGPRQGSGLGAEKGIQHLHLLRRRM